MKIMDNLIDLIYEKSELINKLGIRNILTFVFATLFFSFITITYYFYSITSGLAKNISLLEDQFKQVQVLQKINADINELEASEKMFLASNVLPGNGLLSFVEQKIPQGATLDTNWKSQLKTNLWALDNLYEEQKATLSFSKISTQQLVEFMQGLYTQPAVALREIEINKLPDTLSANLVISYRYKKA